MISSDRRRRRRAVDGEQLLALGARRAKTRRAKEDGVGRAAVVLIVDSVASPPAVADFPALQFHKGLADVVEALTRAVVERLWRRAARGAEEEAEEQHARDDVDQKRRYMKDAGICCCGDFYCVWD